MLPRGYYYVDQLGEPAPRRTRIIAPAGALPPLPPAHSAAAAGARAQRRVSWGERAELGLYLVLWYGASAVCFSTTRQLQMHWSLITMAQLSLSASIGACTLPVLALLPYQPIASLAQLQDTALLAAVFTAGFATLNIALALMHVSLVTSLRACEPVFTLVLAPLLIKTERITWPTVGAMAVTVCGCCLSAAGSGDVSARGMAAVLACNAMWALRAVLTKRQQQRYPGLDLISLFFHISVFGALFQGIIVAAGGYPKPETVTPEPETLNPKPSPLTPHPSALNPQPLHPESMSLLVRFRV
jgi:drug/metabolite transporter (DMT)-like permease